MLRNFPSPEVPAASAVADLIADHEFLRTLLDGIRDAAGEITARHLSTSPLLISLLGELSTVLGQHLIQETTVLIPLIEESSHRALLEEKLRRMHTQQLRLLAAVARWLARDVDAQILARHAAALGEAVRLGLHVEERQVFRELPPRLHPS